MPKEKSAKQIHWEDHISKQEASGMTQRGYCREQGLNSHRMGYWKRKLEAAGQGLAKKPSKRFASITLTNRLGAQDSSYEVIGSQGMSLKFSGDFDLVKAKGLIEILGLQSC